MKVDALKIGPLSSPIGPTGTLRRLIRDEEYFESNGISLNIYTSDDFRLKKSATVNKNIKGSKRNNLISIIKSSYYLSVLWTLRSIWNSKNFVKKYLFLNTDPDIVVFHDFFVCYNYIRLSKKHSKTILFHHSDGIMFEMYYRTFPKLKNTRFSRWLEKIYKNTITDIDRHTFIAKIGQKNFLNENPNMKIQDTCFFHNGIDDLEKEDFAFDSSNKKSRQYKYRLVTVGTVSERKGQHLILEALNKLPRKVLKNIHLTIIGSGPRLETLIKYSKESEIDCNIHFTGSLDNDRIPEYLRISNVYLLLSNNEGLPISIIEAMRSGLPIISTNIAGIPELVSEDNGILIRPNAQELVNILMNLDKYDLDKMGKNSRLRFENEFKWESMRNNYRKMLVELSQND